MIPPFLITYPGEIAWPFIHTDSLRAFASSREPALFFLTRRREEGLPLRQCFALPPPPASCGRIIMVSAEPKILPELVSGRWQPEGLTEGNVV